MGLTWLGKEFKRIILPEEENNAYWSHVLELEYCWFFFSLSLGLGWTDGPSCCCLTQLHGSPRAFSSAAWGRGSPGPQLALSLRTLPWSCCSCLSGEWWLVQKATEADVEFQCRLRPLWRQGLVHNEYLQTLHWLLWVQVEWMCSLTCFPSI